MFNLKLALLIAATTLVTLAECGPGPKGWLEVGPRWPANQFEYWVATEHGHHFIDIKLPRHLDGDLAVRLEYFYNYTRIRPDVRIVPCSTSVDVLNDERLQPRGKWLVHEMPLLREACQANNLLVYNILLHDAGDVFAWRYVRVTRESRHLASNSTTEQSAGESSLQVSEHLGNLTCRPSQCDDKLFKHPRFKALTGGLPEGTMSHLHQGDKVQLNTENGKLLVIQIPKRPEPYERQRQSGESSAGSEQQEATESSTENVITVPRRLQEDACFKVDLFMHANTKLELSLVGSNQSQSKYARPLEVIEPNWYANRWFTIKRCTSDFMPQLHYFDRVITGFQLKPQGSGRDQHILVAQPREASWLEPYISMDTSGDSTTWTVSATGGLRLRQNLSSEFEESPVGQRRLRIKGIDLKADSLTLKSEWLTWEANSDQATWLHYSGERADDWLRNIEFAWQDHRGQWNTPESPIVGAEEAEQAESSSRQLMRFKLDLGHQARHYRLRLRLNLKDNSSGEGSHELVINTLALSKEPLW